MESAFVIQRKGLILSGRGFLVLLFFHCIASLLWANKRIKLTRKKRRGFLVLVAAGKFN